MVRLAILFLCTVTLLAACRPDEPEATGSVAANGAATASETQVRIETDGETDGALNVGPVPVLVYLLNGGEGVSGASVEVTGDMTHAGMVPVIVDAAEVEPGLYRAEDFAFSMAGDWVLTADITLPDGQKLGDEIRVTVAGR